MGNTIVKISKYDYNNKYKDVPELGSLNSREDIATFLDTFEESGLKGYNIERVLTKNSRYIFVYSEGVTGWDFFKEINKLSTIDIDITPQNIKLLFDKTKSRGYYTEEDYTPAINTSDMSMSVDEDAPTGFMGDDSPVMDNVDRRLLHVRRGVRLPINDTHGVIIGRSTSQSEYTVNNTKVSRKHAQVYKEGNKCMVHDFDSANGTFIDGLRVRSDLDRELLVGSSLMLADEEFKLV